LIPTTTTRIRTTYGYTHGRLTSVTYNDGTPNLVHTHDTLGRMRTVTRAGNNHAEYIYDPTNLRLTTEKLNRDHQERHLHRFYDSYGRPLSLNLATTAGTSQYTTGYGYDTAGRLQNLWHHPSLTNGVPQGNPTFTYGYNYTQANPGDLRVGASSGGSLKQDHMPYTLTRNTAGASPALTANRSYQATRDALHAIENKAGTTLVSSYTYSVNSIGQRDNVSTSGSAFAGVPANWSWLYDSLGQVRQADSPTAARDRAYEFDTIGNRKKFAHGTTTLPTNDNYTANTLNQYSQVPSYTPQPVHDLDGNLTRGPVPGLNGNLAGVTAPADATEIKWDAENRMISCKIGTITYYYGYDHLSRQMGRGETTALNRRYYYDGWNRIAEYTTLWTPHNTFTWGLDLSGTLQGAGGVGGLLVMRWVSDAGSPDYFPTYDGNGNVSEYLDTAGTNIVHYEYDPFGGLTRLTGNNSGRFQHRFSTKPRDFSTGLYYYGYRWYDPATGRWPSRDPIEERGGVNLYGFVKNEPTRLFDMLGNEIVVGEKNTGEQQIPQIGKKTLPANLDGFYVKWVPEAETCDKVILSQTISLDSYWNAWGNNKSIKVDNEGSLQTPGYLEAGGVPDPDSNGYLDAPLNGSPSITNIGSGTEPGLWTVEVTAYCLQCDECNFGGTVKSLGTSTILGVAKFTFNNVSRKIGPVAHSKTQSADTQKAYKEWKSKRSGMPGWERIACEALHPDYPGD
jgi:RHS repeat-associated protein